MAAEKTIIVTLSQLAKMIDHALLHPTLTDAETKAGLAIAKDYAVATACVKAYHIPLAKKELESTDVLVCPVIGYPAGNSTTEVKVIEAELAAKAGGSEIDMVVNVGKVLSKEWEYVRREISLVNEAVVRQGALLKVIFENDYLEDEHIIQLCRICSELKVAFIKTSTGFGFVKQANGLYNYKGATFAHLKLMREHSAAEMRIKASGGIRTLDELLQIMSLGVNRVGTSATKAILEEASARGITEHPQAVEVKTLA